MKKYKGNAVLLVVVIVSILGLVGYIAYKNLDLANNQSNLIQTLNTQVSPTATDSDFPVLYPGVKWTKTYEGDLLFRNSNNDILTLKGQTYESEIFKSEPNEIVSYFVNEFQTRGWIQTDNAGGPNGEVFGYQKDQKYFTVQYQAISSDTGPNRKITGYKVIVDHN